MRQTSHPGVLPLVLFAGYKDLPNGFSRVQRSLVEALGRTHACLRFEHAAINDPATQQASLETILRQTIPEIVVLLDVPRVCAERIPLIEVASTARIVCYCAIDDATSLPPAVLRSLTRVHALVVFTQLANRLLADGFASLALAHPPIEIIPHGIDTEVFRPLLPASRRLSQHVARQSMARHDLQPNDFIVLNANRNQPFKRIDLTLEGFALFARNKPPSVKLYLHMGTRRPAPMEVPLADRFHIRERLLATSHETTHPHLDNGALNILYNACDVGINTSEKEGWGLIAFEHAATMAPQLVPGHGATAELWQDAAMLLRTAPIPSSLINREPYTSVSPKAVAEALELLYTDHEARHHSAQAALANATQPRYQWDHIAAQWCQLFRTLL